MKTNQYKLVSLNDSNLEEELEATSFNEALDEALNILQWYVIDDADYFMAVNSRDPNNTVELSERIYEDAQYETLEKIGYYISFTI